MDNYEVVSQIGSGACGFVYLVRSHENGRQYALKKVQLDDQRKTRTKEALLKEVRILSELKHPHIVGYHDSFFADDVEHSCNFIHIVQDYCDSGTLDGKILQKSKEGGYFGETQVMEWFIQIAMAVQYMHSRKILHRDLKPQNVFMTKSDGVKLGDFGIAKVLDNTLDAAVTCVGTPCYLSPELCQDIPYSSKSDIWALGCLLVEMCSLKPAFDALNLISLFYKIINADYRQIPDHYSDDLKIFISKLLIKQPELRLSASAILNTSYVRSYIELFIKDREYLLKQKIISLKCKASGCRSTGSSPTPKSKINHKHEPVRQSAPSHIVPGAHKTVSKIQVQGSIDPSWKVTVPADEIREESPTPDDAELEYSDDFDDSLSDEIVEEILPTDSSSDKVKAATVSPELDCASYVDDFEDDSEAEELDDIINNAREAHSVSPADEFFFDEHHTPSPSKVNSIRKLLDIAEADNSSVKPQLVKASGIEVRHSNAGELMETCYLLEDDEDSQEAK